MKTLMFRDLLKGTKPTILIGAYDGISAKLGELCGFDAVWASGYAISASAGVPDANILTMTDILSASQNINNAVTIPVIADCDNGYGNINNVIHLIRRAEQIGLAGICIEDNAFPKHSSLYSGINQQLVPIEEHVTKIAAAKASQKDPDFVVIARTESLVRGMGLDDALKRAKMYADAGADAILIHSNHTDPEEILTFAKNWSKPCPLVAVPTTYDSIRVSELQDAGFKIVIFANHTLRAAVRAIRETLLVLRHSGCAGTIRDQIASVAEINNLVGESELHDFPFRHIPDTYH